MLSYQDQNITLSDIVRADYRTADVFKKHGLNYCCGGRTALKEACAAQNIDYTLLQEELTTATKTIALPNNLPYHQWKVNFLVDYIVNVHHEYVKQTLPRLEGNLISFVNNHKKQYPELVAVESTFLQLYKIISQHTQVEEEVTFPYIKQIANAYSRKETYGNLFVRTLRKPLSSVDQDHREISALLSQLRSLTHQFTFPENACTNHRVIYQKLQELDNDLTQHKHLENNFLFPKAIEMENALLHP